MMAPMRRPKKAARKRAAAAAIETGVGSVSVDAVRGGLSVVASADRLPRLLPEQEREIVMEFYRDGYWWARLARYEELQVVLSIGDGEEDLHGLFIRCE